jgi:hypothetical protein
LLGIGGQGTTCASHMCVRNTTGASSGVWSVVDQVESFIYDADSAASGLFCSGAVVSTSSGIVQKPIIGFYNTDTASGYPAFNLSDGTLVSQGTSPTCTFLNVHTDGAGNMTYPGIALAQKQRLFSGNSSGYTLDSGYMGTVVFTNATPGSWIFPSISGGNSAYGTNGNWVGGVFEFVNAGGAAVTINSANATQSFNKPTSGKNSYSLAAGGTMTVRICTDGTNAFLAVIANNGAT